MFQVVAPLAKALDVLQSDKMAYYGVLLPTIATLVEKLQKIKRESNLHLFYLFPSLSHLSLWLLLKLMFYTFPFLEVSVR